MEDLEREEWLSSSQLRELRAIKRQNERILRNFWITVYKRHGWTNRQIAEKFGLTEGSVRVMFPHPDRARRIVRELDPIERQIYDDIKDGIPVSDSKNKDVRNALNRLVRNGLIENRGSRCKPDWITSEKWKSRQIAKP